MPKLVFTEDMVEVPPNYGNGQLKKYKLASAIFQLVVVLHNGPAILDFNCWVRPLVLDSEFSQIISYFARGNKLKELIFINDNCNKLPFSFFSLQGLELIRLVNCTFVPPSAFKGFSRLKSLTFFNVKVSAQMLQRFLSKCPLLELISLGYQEGIDFVAGGNKFTYVDLLQCVPLIRSLEISIYYMKYLSAGGMPRKLPTSLVRLKHLSLVVCMAEQNDISSALCIIRSSPLLAKISFKMYDDEKLRLQQNSTNLLDPDDFSDLNLDHLETLNIEMFSNLPLEMEFVKLFMGKSPVLKKVRIELDDYVSVDEELKILRDLVLLPFPRASPSAKLIIRRSETCL